MKERELANLCTCITHSELNRLIEEENKKEFKSKNQINRLMIGNVEEVRKETQDIWKKIIQNDPLYKDALKPSQSEIPPTDDVNKGEDTQDVAEQRVLDTVEVEPAK